MSTSEKILERVERRAKVAGLARVLGVRLGADELTSLLLAVFEERTARLTAARVLDRWERDAFVRPCDVGPHRLARATAAAYEAAQGFEAVELSPVAPLGAVSVLGPVSQKNVVSSVRNLEVIADPTNVMALECAVRRRARLAEDSRDATRVRLCASQRVVRGQRDEEPNHTQHFRLLATCTAGRDEGSHRFEIEALAEHVVVQVRLFDALREAGFDGPRSEQVRVELEGQAWIDGAKELLASLLPELPVESKPPRDTAYYPDGSFKVVAPAPHGEIAIGDGGIVPWTQRLLSNRKERLCIGGFGLELACRLWPDVAA